jgi:hypothetical protein
MTDDGPEDYTVGYKRPPRKTRFSPGQSGNPRGRPKGAKTLVAAIQREMDTRIAVNENGRRRMITKREAVAKQLVNKAAGGDHRAIPHLLNEVRALENPANPTEKHDAFSRPEDALVMENILRRIRSAEGTSSEGIADGESPDLISANHLPPKKETT